MPTVRKTPKKASSVLKQNRLVKRRETEKDRVIDEYKKYVDSLHAQLIVLETTCAYAELLEFNPTVH